MLCDETFKAEIFSGKKEGEFFVSIYSKNIRNALGFNPFPGTLNAKLINNVDKFNECVLRTKMIAIDPPNIPDMKLGRVIAYPIVIFDSLNAYVIRPEITIYRKDVIEIISDKRLRDILNLTDGSIIEISLVIDKKD